MFNSRKLLTTSLLAIASYSSSAGAGWSGGIEAGTLLGSGESPAIRAYVNNTNVPLSHYVYLDWIHKSGSSSYRLGYDPTYTISQSIFSFGNFSIDQDDPGEIAREVNAKVGIGNNFFRTKNSQFTIRGGIGGSRIKLADSNEQTDGYFFAGGLLSSKLIGLLKFEAVLESRLADSQTVSTGEAGISFRVGPNTAVKYAYSTKRYNFGDGKEDIVNEDSFVTMTYGF